MCQAELKERTAAQLMSERMRVMAQLQGAENVPCAKCAREQVIPYAFGPTHIANSSNM